MKMERCITIGALLVALGCVWSSRSHPLEADPQESPQEKVTGIGGVFLEVLRDVTFRVPPFDKAEARRMIDEVRGAAMLRGARGVPKASIPAHVDVIMKVQRLAVDLHDEVAELDINPLVALPKRAVALDALVVRT